MARRWADLGTDRLGGALAFGIVQQHCGACVGGGTYNGCTNSTRSARYQDGLAFEICHVQESRLPLALSLRKTVKTSLDGPSGVASRLCGQYLWSRSQLPR